MKRSLPQLVRARKLASLLLFAIPLTMQAQKVWTGPASGLWRDTNNWNGHVLPDVTSFVQIATNNSATVAIDALTLPDNLTIQMLTLSAPAGATNTLLLNNAGTNNPLIMQTGLEIMDGGFLRITNSALLMDFTNFHVNIDGAMTLDSGSIDFGDTTVTARVGRATSGTLTINSGSVSAGALTVGGLINSSGVLNQNGGTLSVGGLFSVGRNPATTGAVYVAGGLLSAQGDIARIGDTGVGQMTVTNATLLTTNIQVGRDSNSLGTFTIRTGALVAVSNEMSIARFNGSTGNVFVTGGQLTASGQTIHVGYEGIGQMTFSGGSVLASSVRVAADMTNSASGTLTVSGGLIGATSGLLVGGNSFSTGQVVISGGEVSVTNAAASAVISAINGGIQVNGGTIDADILQATNAPGSITFNGGTINTRSTSVANGVAFVVGNGITPATLHLNGGVHSFANGLVISSNATVNGCGTIIGSIVNHGTLATNCVPMLVRPTITKLTRVGATSTISFTTVAGQTYTLEFKNSANATNWTSISPSTNGTGSTMSLTDTSAGTSVRFYRVRAQ